jgi:hypothetical protein
MKNGDISNVSSPQVVCVTDVVITLVEEVTGKLFLTRVNYKLGDIQLEGAHKLWKLSNDYGLSLELVGYADAGWTEELLDKAFEKLEREIVNPFNYWQLYADPDELIRKIPYRANLRGVVDIPDRVARYGSAGVELKNL